jgi:hypothetical protein
MKTENAASEPNMGTTSSSERGKNAPSKDDDRKSAADKSSDADFLSRQAEEAMAAIKRTLTEMKGELAEGVNPVEWAREYPWLTLGASAVAGFVATSMLVPSKEEQALRKLARIERALNPERHRREPAKHEDNNGNGKADHAEAGGGGMMSMLARELIKTLRPALVSLITAGVAGKVAKPSEEEMKAAAAKEDAEQAAGGGSAGPG